MGIARRVAERGGDAGFELVGDVMLEALGLGVDLVPLVAERFGQIELQQAVVADDAQGDLFAGGGQRHVAVARVLHQPQLVQALDHIGHRGTGEAPAPRPGAAW